MHVEKTDWTDDNFEEMGWHDCKIYAIAFDGDKFELSFDIDYILQFEQPEAGKVNYSFWISPATLVFTNVYDVNISADSTDVDIQEVFRDAPTIPKNIHHVDRLVEYTWTIETTAGSITFNSIGYKQTIRKQPRLYDSYSIGLLERGGISFEDVYKG